MSVAGTAGPFALAGTGSPRPASPGGAVADVAPPPPGPLLGLPENWDSPAGGQGVVLPLTDRRLDDQAKPAGDAAPQAGSGGDQVTQWITEAVQIMREQDIPVSAADVAGIRTIVEKESNGDPRAVNQWDANARAGHPSKGLMQCTDPTFDSYKLAGHDDIYNPVDNIIAGVRYTIGRYGGFASHPGLASLNRGDGYRGY
jgi:hypothetical protein